MTTPAQLSAALTGRYTVEREIGRGGMATVYLARDERHERNVALKLLDPELGAVLGVERFLSEIRVTANLQHPNLLPLFDSGEADGLLFYVMPYVEGETLRHRLEREKQLPVDEAVRIAVAVASALDYAHARGVIHRDLKPENILLQAGQPVVADFGIALAVSKAGGARVTQTGLSLGTPQYMSPEQATGDRVIDGRSDIYSLAAVLYEMLTGEPPHTGNTMQAVIARVLTEQPRSVRATRPSVPEHVELAIERALEKLPADRWPTAGEFAGALQGKTTVATRAVVKKPRATFAGVIVPWTLVAVLAATAGWAWWTVGHQSAPAPTRFVLSFPPNERFEDVSGKTILLSPDGRALVYSARSEKGSMLYYRPLDELSARPLAGTEGAADLFFSPDSRSIGFAQGTGVKTLLIAGGSSTLLGTINSRGAAWTQNGQIIVATPRGFQRVSASGGSVETLATSDSALRGASIGTMPVALDDGNTVVFWASAPGDSSGLRVLRLDTKQVTPLEGLALNPIGVLDGWLLFGRPDGTVAATRFDAKTTRSVSDAVPVLDGVLTRSQGGVVASVSRNGSLVYIRGASTNQLVIVNEHGAKIGMSTGGRLFSDPQFSPDGRQVAMTIESNNSADIWVLDVATEVLRRITTRTRSVRPEWTPDGKRIAYMSGANTSPEVWWVPADNSGPEEKLYTSTTPMGEVSFSPDGKYALLRTAKAGGPTARDIWLLPLSGERKATPLLESTFNENQPVVSPDSRWLAYVSDESGANQIYIRPFPGAGGKLQVSPAGGVEPQWAKDGRLFYRTADSLVAVTLTTQPALAVAHQGSVFDDHTRPSTARAQYGVHPNGKEFAVLRPSADGDVQIVVVLNWITEFRAKLAQAGKR